MSFTDPKIVKAFHFLPFMYRFYLISLNIWIHCTLVLLQQDFLRTWNPDPCCHKVIFLLSPVFSSFPSNNTYSGIYSDNLSFRSIISSVLVSLFFCFFILDSWLFPYVFRSHLINRRNHKKIKKKWHLCGKKPLFTPKLY